jgi:hypothetical protein
MGKVENIVFLSLVLDLFGNLLYPFLFQRPTRLRSFHHSAPAVSTYHRVVRSGATHPQAAAIPPIFTQHTPKTLEGSIGPSWFFVLDTAGGVRDPRPVLQPISQLPEMGYRPSRCIYSLFISLFYASLHDVAIAKVVSWALCSREQYTLRVGLTNHVSSCLLSIEHFNFSYRRTSDLYLISMAAKKSF